VRQGRFAYQSFHVDDRITEPMVRDGGQLRPVTWERALSEAAAADARRENTGAIASARARRGGTAPRALMREGLRSPHIDSRRSAA